MSGPKPVESVKITPESPEVKAGENGQLTAEITPADASAQISAYYAAATKLTGDAYGTTTIFNLPRQTSYAVTVPIPGMLYGSNPLNADLLNRASVENALTKYVKDQNLTGAGNPELRAIAGF